VSPAAERDGCRVVTSRSGIKLGALMLRPPALQEHCDSRQGRGHLEPQDLRGVRGGQTSASRLRLSCPLPDPAL